MDIGGPLRGTWMVMLFISIVFVAAGVASAEPWSTPSRVAVAAQSADPTITTSTSLSHPTATAPSPARGSASTISALGPTDAGGVTAVPDDLQAGQTEEHDLWDRAQNHGFFVSRQAHDATGASKGCEVTGVARSDIGKPETANSEPTSSTAACEDEIGKASSDKAQNDKAQNDKAQNDKAQNDKAQNDKGTDE